MVKKGKKREHMQSKTDVIASDELRERVGGALDIINSHSKVFQESMNMSEDEAKREIAKMYYRGLKTASNPLSASQHILALALMGQEMKMAIDPMSITDTDQWSKILGELRKSVKLISDIEGKKISISHTINKEEKDMVFNFEDANFTEQE